MIAFALIVALSEDAAYAQLIRESFTKHELRVPMRDGVRLFTHVYVPKDDTRAYPIMFMRTPYSVAPYGIDNFPSEKEARQMRRMFPNESMVRAGYIFVQQDVRGRMMSEGEFVDVRPRGPVDETTDAYDTIDYLLKHVPRHNGNVGVWGTSYPGFYAAQAAVDAHPAVKAVSPQGPMTDVFEGDDFHHNGAFMLADAYLFYRSFGVARPKPVDKWSWDDALPGAGDLYEYFLQMGTVPRLPGAFWQDLMREGNRSAFWQARDARPRYKNAKPAIMVVGGWFDCEDLWGALQTHKAFGKQLVMGPWKHGGWHRGTGDSLGDVSFSTKTSAYYQEQIELPFFDKHLKGKDGKQANVIAFETGSNEWRRYDAWPPKTTTQTWYLGDTLSQTPPPARNDSFIADPAHPVPFTDKMLLERGHEFMTGDQRFASRRPDVLTYASAPMQQDLVLAGPIDADLRVTVTGSDADFIVKVIDQYPANAPLPGYQQLVRYEVMRGKFRNSLEMPEPFTPGVVTQVKLTLPDVNHAFRVGHRMVVQVQSSLFPLVDRNPQVFTDIYHAKASDYRAQTHTLQLGKSSITVRAR